MTDKPKLGPEQSHFSLLLVDPDIPPDEDPNHERVKVQETLEARKVLAEVAAKEGKPGGLPLLARSVHKLWSPGVATPEVVQPTPEDVEMAELTRQDRPSTAGSCCQCVHYDHAEGQRRLSHSDLHEQLVTELGGPSAVARLGDLRLYGWCEVDQGLTATWAPMCPEWRDKTKMLGRIYGGAVGLWKRLGGI